MIPKNTPTIGDPSFEELKKSNEHDAEYWSARDLQPLLGYSQWRRLEDAIGRAITSCEKSGNNPDPNFAGAGQMILVGKGGTREVDNYQLSRFACYLIAQNKDPRKPESAAHRLNKSLPPHTSRKSRNASKILCPKWNWMRRMRAVYLAK